MEPRIFDEVAADDVAGDEEVAQMFGEDHEKGGHDHHDGAEIKAGRIKGGDGKPFFRGYIGKIDDAHDDGKDISRDDADKNRNNGNKSAAQYSGENGDDEGKHGNHDSHGICHTLCFSEEARHAHGKRGKLQADNGDDGAHSGGREQHINP